MTQDFVLRGATIVTMNDEMDVVAGGDIVVVDGRIAEVGQRADGRGALPVVDATGMVAIPGFVQPHVHLCQSLFRNLADDLRLMDWLRTRIWPFEGAHTKATMRATADLGLAELIASGTTSIIDMGTVHHTGVVAEAIVDSGIRAVIGKAMMDKGEQIPDSLQESRRDSMAESLALARQWDGAADGRIRYALTPRFAFSCSRELLEECGDVARSRGLMVHTHANETTWEATESVKRWGMTNTEYLHQCGITGPRSVFAHGVHLAEVEREILADTKTTIAHCPSSNLKLGSGIANIPMLWDDGIPVALAADGAPCNNNLDAFVEMRLAALIQKPLRGPTSMRAADVVRLATRDGAAALGLADEVGSLEVGKSADIVLLNLDKPRHGISGPVAERLGGNVYAQIVYSASSADVVDVWASGRHLVRNRQLTGYDTVELQRRGKEALTTIAKRLDHLAG